jgi:hypothetical protein
MSPDTIIGVAGAAASLAGAGIAIWQSRTARGYKEGAESAAMAIAERNELVANNSIADKCESAMSLVSFFGPGHIADDLERRDLRQIMQDFRALYEQIDTLSRRYGVRNGSTANTFVGVEAALNRLATTGSTDEGRSLYVAIRDLVVVVRQSADAQALAGGLLRK